MTETWTTEQAKDYFKTGKTPKKKGNISTSTLKKKAITVFNAFIRNRDKDKPCISCGAYKVQQAGHFYSAGHHNHIRFDEDNVHGQCIRCNNYLSGNLINYRAALENRIGKERLEALDLKAKWKRGHKDDKFLFAEIIEKYNPLLT
jgi:Bacteriophage Lambda NinG protein